MERQNLKNIILGVFAVPETRKRLYAITLVCSLLLIITGIRDNSVGQEYITDEKGNLIAIHRDSTDKSSEFIVELVEKGEKGKEDIVKLYSVNPGIGRNKSENVNDELVDKRIIHDAEIEGILFEIENSDSKRLEFPNKLSDGTPIKWKRLDKGNGEYKNVIILYLITVFIIVAGTRDRNKIKTLENQKKIAACIPRFTNQLLLLMNAGLILSDAVKKICVSYEMIPVAERNIFESEMIRISRSNDDNSKSTASMVNDLASKYNVKELMRIAAFMNDNEKKGSNILESLSRESRYMWEDIKISAIELGKIADLKMTYPLGLLLILLIVITMAPALITM